MRYYSARKRSELQLHVATQRDLKIIMLHEKKTGKKKELTIQFHVYKILENANYLVVTNSCLAVVAEEGMGCKETGRNFGG